MGWYIYYVGYDGKMVGSDAWNMKQTRLDDSWGDCPRREYGTAFLYEGGTLEDELLGMKNRRLWSYIKSHKAYHCKGDNRKSLATFYGYRTYSLAGGLNGQWAADFFTEITNVSELMYPSTKYVSVENAVYPTAAGAGQFWSYGAWVLNYPQAYLYDPMASFHNKVTTLGFCNGHAEKYKCRNSETWEWVEAGLPKNLYLTAGSANALENVDVRYFLNGFACKENPN